VLQNGGSLIIEQTEALVSIDVNGGHSMFGQGTSQEKAILDVNLEAAKQVCALCFCFAGKQYICFQIVSQNLSVS
jgi:Ribonuclease G/E